MGTALTIQEKSRLKDLKAIVARGLNGFLEVGMALAEIRDRQLYRESHRTFKEFIRAEFGLAERHAQRLMVASKIAEDLLPPESTTRPIGRVPDNAGPVLPQTESQVRALADVPEDQRREAWETAVASANGQQPTAEQVQEAADEVQAAIPERLQPIFKHVPLWKAAAGMLKRAAAMLKVVEDSLLWQQLDGGKHVFNVKLLSTAEAILKRLPKCPCPECGGNHEPSQDNDPCKKCGDKGFLTAEEASW